MSIPDYCNAAINTFFLVLTNGGLMYKAAS
jgi:hypothetical protein